MIHFGGRLKTDRQNRRAIDGMKFWHESPMLANTQYTNIGQPEIPLQLTKSSDFCEIFFFFFLYFFFTCNQVKEVFSYDRKSLYPKHPSKPKLTRNKSQQLKIFPIAAHTKCNDKEEEDNYNFLRISRNKGSRPIGEIQCYGDTTG